METICILVSGEVQGVFYRQSTKEKAKEFGITGKVMNLSDGRVKIIATGKNEQLEKLIKWCHKGPERAEVSEVIVEKQSLQLFNSFVVERH